MPGYPHTPIRKPSTHAQPMPRPWPRLWTASTRPRPYRTSPPWYHLSVRLLGALAVAGYTALLVVMVVYSLHHPDPWLPTEQALLSWILVICIAGLCVGVRLIRRG